MADQPSTVRANAAISRIDSEKGCSHQKSVFGRIRALAVRTSGVQFAPSPTIRSARDSARTIYWRHQVAPPRRWPNAIQSIHANKAFLLPSASLLIACNRQAPAGSNPHFAVSRCCGSDRQVPKVREYGDDGNRIGLVRDLRVSAQRQSVGVRSAIAILDLSRRDLNPANGPAWSTLTEKYTRQVMRRCPAGWVRLVQFTERLQCQAAQIE